MGTYCRTHGRLRSECGCDRARELLAKLTAHTPTPAEVLDMEQGTDWPEDTHAPRPCGLGVCAANEGHPGTCAEASGWADDDECMEIFSQHTIRQQIQKWENRP